MRGSNRGGTCPLATGGPRVWELQGGAHAWKQQGGHIHDSNRGGHLYSVHDLPLQLGTL